MVRRLMIISISLVGLTLALGSNAWADRDRGGREHRNDKGYHHNDKTPKGNHYGWEKGRGNSHREHYKHRREYRHGDRYHRWDRDLHWNYHNRDRYHRDRRHQYRSHGHYRGSRFNAAVKVYR